MDIHLRPPSARPPGGRPPRGPTTLARPKKRPAQAQLLTEAAQFLDAAEKPEHAEAVREALSDLTRTRVRADNPTFTVYVHHETWQAAQQAAEGSGRSVPDLVEEGFATFLAGDFEPQKAPRGPGSEKDTFSVRAAQERRQEVTDYATAHAADLGWCPSPRQVAAAWLEHRYGPDSRP